MVNVENEGDGAEKRVRTNRKHRFDIIPIVRLVALIATNWCYANRSSSAIRFFRCFHGNAQIGNEMFKFAVASFFIRLPQK
jgi:hypothetical protein